MRVNMPKSDEPDLDVAPLIDMVFLLVVYFMVTASLVKSEGDLGIKLPGMLQQATKVDMPDEQIIQITETGRVFLNSREYDSADSQDLPELYTLMKQYKLASESSKNKAMVTIAADDTTTHQRVIDVMNACAAAGIKNVTFSASTG